MTTKRSKKPKCKIANKKFLISNNAARSSQLTHHGTELDPPVDKYVAIN